MWKCFHIEPHTCLISSYAVSLLVLKLKFLNGNFLGEMNCNFVVKIVIASTEQVSKYTVFEADQFFYGCQSFFFFFFLGLWFILPETWNGVKLQNPVNYTPKVYLFRLECHSKIIYIKKKLFHENVFMNTGDLTYFTPCTMVLTAYSP